jgi:hypothetical protein
MLTTYGTIYGTMPLTCTCGRLTNPLSCPVHNGSGSVSYPGATLVISELPTPVVRCARCQTALEVQNVYGMPGSISYQVQPHRCPKKAKSR